MIKLLVIFVISKSSGLRIGFKILEPIINVNPKVASELSNGGTWKVQWPNGKDGSGNLSKAEVLYTPSGWTSPMKEPNAADACACLTHGNKDRFHMHFVGDSHSRHFFSGMSNILTGDQEGLAGKDDGIPPEFKDLCGGNNQYLHESQCHDKIKLEKVVCNGLVKLVYTEMWLPKHFYGSLDALLKQWQGESQNDGGQIGIIIGTGHHFLTRGKASDFEKVTEHVLSQVEAIKPAFTLWNTMFSQTCQPPGKWKAQEPALIAGNAAMSGVVKKHPKVALLDGYNLVFGHCELRTEDHAHCQLPVQLQKSSITLHSMCPNML